MNKKAQSIQDGFYLIAVLLFLVIGAFSTIYFYNQFMVGVRANAQFNQTAPMVGFTAGETVNEMWDYLIFVVLIAFAIGMVILGYFIQVESVFFPLYIIGMIVGVIVSFVFQYIYEKLADTVQFAPLVSSHLPMTNVIFSNLPLYYTVIAVLAFVATYAKSRSMAEV